MVPVIYSLLRTQLPTAHLLEKRFAAEERGEDPPRRVQADSQQRRKAVMTQSAAKGTSPAPTWFTS